MCGTALGVQLQDLEGTKTEDCVLLSDPSYHNHPAAGEDLLIDHSALISL
jgi:hypothetical protein